MNPNTGSVEYSQNISASQTKVDQPKEQVELFFSVLESNLAPNRAYSISAEILTKKQKSRLNLGETNQKPGGNQKIDFDKTFVIDYFFEMKQTLKVILLQDKVPVLDIETTVGKIMGSRNQQQNLVFNKNGLTGSIKVHGVPIKSSNTSFCLGLTINFGKDKTIKPFYIVKRNSSGKLNEINWIQAYKSEVLMDFPNRVNFNIVTFTTQFICNENVQKMPVLIEFFDLNNPKQPIGGYCANVQQMVDNTGKDFCLMNPQGQQIKDKVIQLGTKYIKQSRFLDYIQSGLQISSMVGIDFTASNGNPNDQNSLHSVHKKPNLYEMAIDHCCGVISNYDSDQLFPVFGYGAKVDPKIDTVSHCFPVNMTNDPNIFKVEGILSSYRTLIQNPSVKLHGPTHFAPIIKICTQLAKNVKSSMSYSILMILTDGMINDWEDTVDAIVEASKIPLSIIIIGIGPDEDEMFPDMRELDSDNKKLENSLGVKVMRDIVQFVEFDKLGNDPKVLSEKVLEEIPKQVEEYFQIMGITPPEKKD